MDDSTETNEETLFYLLHFFKLTILIFVGYLHPSEHAAKLQMMHSTWLYLFPSASPDEAKVLKASQLNPSIMSELETISLKLVFVKTIYNMRQEVINNNI